MTWYIITAVLSGKAWWATARNLCMDIIRRWIYIYIYTIKYGVPWITIICHEWGDSSRVKIIAESPHEWQKSEFTVIHTLFYFLHAILCLDRAHKSSIVHFVIFANDGLFWLDIVTWPSFNRWRLAEKTYCHCDVIFVDCSCTRKMAQTRSSLVNNNRDFPIRYSRLSV